MIWEHLPKPQHIGLALAGGAARGSAHVGVLQVLEEHGIRPHFIAGTSVGSLVGGLYAAGVSPTRMEELVRQLKWLKISTLRLPSINLGAISFSNINVAALNLPLGLLDLDKMIEWIDQITGGPIDFADLRIPFAAVATDINSGEMLVLNQGPIAPAIRASSAVPGIFTPARRGSRLLVDGGVVRNLPVDVVQQMGAEYVIAVDLVPVNQVNDQVSEQRTTEQSEVIRLLQEPHHVIDLLITSLYALIRSTYSNTEANCTITPAIAHINFGDLGAAPELIAAGRVAAEAAIPQILRDLGRDVA